MYENPVGQGDCDWCSKNDRLFKHTMEDGDFVHICSVCLWMAVCKPPSKEDAYNIGVDMA